jgi:CHR family chromate ion efflux transporter
MKQLIKIFLIFFKIGATTFGGGYAMLPIIERELVENSRLISSDEFVDFISIAQSFPGPIAVNISLLIGYRLSGLTGSIFALLGTAMPSFLSIVAIGYFYSKFRDNKAVHGFFSGVNAVVPALLLISFISVFKKISKKILMYIIFALSFIAVFFLNINPILIILAGGVLGLCMKY